MDGSLAVDFRDVVIEVLRSSNSTKASTNPAAGICSRRDTPKPKQKGNRDVDQLSPVDCVTTNANSSQDESQLHIFEDNEAVIKMIIKGRSPTMRHMSRTYRVALDWLFDKVDLDPKIQIKNVDTKNQLADMLIKGNFTCDEWDHFLRLLNIMSVSRFSCSHFNDFLSDDQVRKQSALSKRGQEATSNEGSPMAKAKPCLVARDPRSEENSSQNLGYPVNPGNVDGHSLWKQLAIRFKIRSRIC